MIGLIGKTNIFNHLLYQIEKVVVASVHVLYRYCGITNTAHIHTTEVRRRQPLVMFGVRRALVTVLPVQ